MILNRGDTGPEVAQLQLKLRAAGYDPGAADGIFGKRTEAAVLEFQMDRPDLDDDGDAGPMTLGALDAAVLQFPTEPVQGPALELDQANDDTWARFERLVDLITSKPVRYGPGRGLWDNGRFLITYGAGKKNGTVKQWPNVLNKTYPAFHCTSWCNFFLSWLCRRNQDFTHPGNIPAIWDLLMKSPDIHPKPYPYRGFGDVARPIAPDGSASRRHRVAKIMDAREIYERRDDLPTFMIFGQSTKKIVDGEKKWRWWHHTGVYATRGGRLYRIAADGSRGENGYSAKPMRMTEITEKNLPSYANVIYRVYGLHTADGTFGDPARHYAEIAFEE